MRKAIKSIIVGIASLCALGFLLNACALPWNVNDPDHSPSDVGITVYTETICAHQMDGLSHIQMGWVFLDRKKHRLAAKEFKAAVKADSGNAEAFNALGVSMDALGDHDKAVAAYSAALAIDSELADAHNNLGYSNLLQGQTSAAIKSLKQALALDAKNIRFQNNLALAYSKTGEYEAAYELFEAAGGQAKGHLNIARIYYRNGVYDKAAVHFAKASALKSNARVIDKAFAAATNLAQIHVAEPQNIKDGRQSWNGDKQKAGLGAKGYYVIPGGAIQEVTVVEIDRGMLAEANHDIRLTHDRAVYTVAAARNITPQEVRARATQTIKVTSSEIFEEIQPLELIQKTAIDADKSVTARIEIEVSNGNGVRHMAQRVGNYLREKGFIFMYLSNADRFNYEETTIYYTSGYLGEACRLSQALPGLQNMEEVSVIKDGNAEICIRIGRDLVQYSSLLNKG